MSDDCLDNDPSCPCGGATMPRLLQPMILLALLDGPAHGYEIQQRLMATGLLGGDAPAEAGIYRMLKEMTDRQLCTPDWDTSGTGPARKVYSLTPSGRFCLARWRETIDDYKRYLTALSRRITKATS